MASEEATSKTTPEAAVQEGASQNQGKVESGTVEKTTTETTTQKLAKGFAQMTGATPSEAELKRAGAQEQSQSAATKERTATDSESTEQTTPKEEKQKEKGEQAPQLSEEEKQRRAEQSAADRAKHQQEMDAQRQKQREEQEKRRKEMLGLDDELLGQEARRQIESQALQEQIIAQVRPQIEQEVHANTRVMVASEMISTIGNEDLQNQVLAHSSEWKSPADFYAAYNKAVADKAIEEFRTKEMPKLLDEARTAGRNEARSVDEEIPLPQFDSGTTPSKALKTSGERLQFGLDQMRKHR